MFKHSVILYFGARKTHRASTGTTQKVARFQLVTPETTATSRRTMARSEQRMLNSRQRATHQHGARKTLKQHRSHSDDCGFKEDAWDSWNNNVQARCHPSL